MTDRRRLYNLRSSPGDGKLVRSVSDEYDDDEFLIGAGRLKKPSPINYLRICVFCVVFISVFVSGYFCHVLVAGFSRSSESQIAGKIGDVINPEQIKEYHIELTKQSHMAGTAQNYELAEYIAQKFLEFSFDDVKVTNYSVRLPYPDQNKPNSVKLLDSTGGVKHICKTTETPLTEFEKTHPTSPLFNAHSKPGTVKRPYVYVNTAMKQDFELLEKYNVSVKDKIVLARYGGGYRGNKVKLAADAGAVAIVLFKDLKLPSNHLRYPESEFAPSSAAERGNVKVGDGDTDTPGWPSVEDGFLKADGELLSAPIIAQPITGDDAVVLLRALSQNKEMVIPPNWMVGLLEKESVNVGTGADDGPWLEVNVNVDIKRVNITNVIGTITGSREPDRWVMLGNHRDSWTYGAMDPSSGTAAMLEVGRSLSTFLDKGWKPRRTIKLCSWDAEEWGLIGSLEWIEEHRTVLESRGVLYVNTDVAEGGVCQEVGGSGSPMYETLVSDVLSEINGEPYKEYVLSGSGSDMYGFYCYAGVSVVDVGCSGNHDLYHTKYDTQRLFEIVDKDYKNLANVSSVLAQIIVGASEQLVVPGNVLIYAKRIEEWWVIIKPDVSSSLKRYELDGGIAKVFENTLVHLIQAAENFQKETLDKLTKSNSEIELRRANDVILEFERAFIVDEEIPGTTFNSKNILVSPSITNLYKGYGFPGLRYATQSSNSTKDTLLFELERSRWALNNAIQVLTL